MSSDLSLFESSVRTSPSSTGSFPVVDFGTNLVDVAMLFAKFDSRHLFVRDDQGHLVGIVSTSDVEGAIRDFDNGVGPNWHSRNVESLLRVSLAKPVEANRHPGTSGDEPFDCLSICEGSSLVAMLTQSDVLFSWNRLEPTLAQASIDALTQLPNRAHFERRFETEWQRAARQRLSMGVLLIDIDNFKHINDRFGHIRGDMVLSAISRVCQTQLRSYDVVARYAGDEFIALTTGCNADDIDLPIRRLQDATRELQLMFGGERISVSLSIGASVICSGYSQLRASDMIEAADRCLYKSKNSGRDRAYRVELHPDGSLSPETYVETGCSTT